MEVIIKPIIVSHRNECMRQTIKKIIETKSEEQAFYLCNVDDLIEKYQRWRSMIPRIEPYYAVKCNNHPNVLKVLSALGLGFDCASKNEIDQILSLGVSPSRIIYAHTTKPPSHLRFAAASNVRLMTFDNEMELYKIKNICPEARAVIRIRHDAKDAIRKLGRKFGCDAITEALPLLQLARDLGINVVGVSFHVGSCCQDLSAFYGAIRSARYVFDAAKTLDYDLELLDIGGGYPGEKDSSRFSEYAKIINEAIDKYFPDNSVKMISEPGMYFVQSAFTLAVNVHSLKEIKTQDPLTDKICTSYSYYINDGIYGTLRIGKEIPLFPEPLKDCAGDEQYPSTVWGPTCDSTDKIREDYLLPKLNMGDWLIISNVGAYTMCLCSKFNGFDAPDVYSKMNSKNWLLLKSTNLFKEADFLQVDNTDPSHESQKCTEKKIHYKVSENFYIRA